MSRAVIVTAIPVEFDAVLSSPSLSNLKKDKQPGSIYRQGKFLGTSWEVLIVRSGKGNIAAASATVNALKYFKPDVAFFVGVAGGIKDASLGDVVIADEVLYYEFVKVGSKEKVQARPSGYRPDSDLVPIAYDEAITKEWLKRLENSNPVDAPKAFVGMIASGEKLVASRRSALYKFLKNYYNQAMAVEMEGYGFLQACYLNKVPGLVIRGISDLLSGKNKADAGGSQETAAKNATAFTFQVLAELSGDGSCLDENCLDKVINVPQLPSSFVSREQDFKKVEKALLSNKNITISITGQKVGFWGMGGIGKTVLAAAIARNKEVRKHFPDGIFWLTLGQEPDLINRQLQLARNLGEKERSIIDVQDGRSYLSSLLADRACLIILDDVWNAKHIDAFNVLGPASKMMITTRKAELLRVGGAFEYNLDILEKEEAWELLAKQAHQKLEDLPIEAKEVAKECGYLPLALAMVGAMVQGRPERWKVVLHRLREADLSKIKTDLLDYPYSNLFRALEVSVNDLDPQYRNRYLDLAAFPEDTIVPLEALETFWEPEGLNKFDVSDLTDEFINRSLARSGGNGLTLHDLQYDFVRSQGGDLKALHRRLLDAYGKKCPNGWPSGPDDGYFFQHLAYHLSGAGLLEDLKSLLLDFNWIRSKLDACHETNLLVSDYDFAQPQEDNDIRLLQKAIRFSANVLNHDPSQIPGQLFGRLIDIKSSRIQALLDQALEATSYPWLRSRTPSLISFSRGISAIVVAPNNRKALSGSSYRTIEIWDLKTGNEIGTLKGHTKGINSIALTADGKRAISGSSDNTIKVWDLETGQEIRTLKGHTDSIFSVAISPDGRRAISGSEDHMVKIWDLKKGQEIRTLKGHTDSIFSVAISPDGRRAISGSDDSTVKIWDLEKGLEIRTLRGHADWISAVSFSLDGRRVISGSWDHTAKIWDIETGQEIFTLEGHFREVSALAVSPDGRRVVSGSWDHTAKIWDIETGQEIFTLVGHNREIGALAVSPDGQRVVSGSWDHTAKVWDIETGKEILTLEGQIIGISALAVFPDGRMALSGSSDGIIKLLDSENGKEILTLEGHTDSIHSIALTADGTRAISGSSDNTIRVWDLRTRQEIITLHDHTNGISVVTATPDGKRALSGSNDGAIKVWDLETGQEILTIKVHTDSIHSIALTADGTRVVSGSSDNTIKVWDLETGQEIITLHDHTNGISVVTVTPDGKRALSGSNDGAIKVWDLETGQEINVHKVHTGIIFAVSVFHNSRMVLSGSNDGKINIFDMEMGNTIATFSVASMTAVSVSKDERNIIAGDNSGTIHFLVLENIIPVASAQACRPRL